MHKYNIVLFLLTKEIITVYFLLLTSISIEGMGWNRTLLEPASWESAMLMSVHIDGGEEWYNNQLNFQYIWLRGYLGCRGLWRLQSAAYLRQVCYLCWLLQ